MSAAASLATLPATLLADVGCYLPPRDATVLDAVLRSAFVRQRGADGSCGDDVLHAVWKRLWYRDYGDVLLQWKIARQAFVRSLVVGLAVESVDLDRHVPTAEEGWVEERLSTCLDDTGRTSVSSTRKDFYCEEGWLEKQLSKHLDDMARTTRSSGMKEFYFLFGECHVDYLLARKNTAAECYLGLHGHIFDFTDFAEYHPGLSEPILKECGGDATFLFEDLPHSTGARNIARRLCVVVNHGVVDHGVGDPPGGRRCGLELVRDGDTVGRKRALRASNTSPPAPAHAVAVRQDEAGQRRRQMPHLLPRGRRPRRPPTLGSVRRRFLLERDLQRYCDLGRSDDGKKGELLRPHDSFLGKMTPEFLLRHCQFWKPHHAPESRNYYDPLLQKWIRWNAEDN